MVFMVSMICSGLFLCLTEILASGERPPKPEALRGTFSEKNKCLWTAVHSSPLERLGCRDDHFHKFSQ